MTIKSKKNINVLTVEKCLEQVDLIDFYITKNILNIIKDKNKFNFLKINIFLLAITNKNNKNSLIILLESGKYGLIKYLINKFPIILNYKNIQENNLLKLLLNYNIFYKYIQNKIKELEIYFLIKILTIKNNFNINFIDNLIFLINSNISFFYFKNKNDDLKKELLNELICIGKNIYLLDNEKKTLLITNFCRLIENEKYLLDILIIFEINNFDMYPDSNMCIAIDYLIFNEYYNVLIYLIEKINYIEFLNIENNIIFMLLENNNISLELKSEILLKILAKINISKFKNNKNQSIFYWLIYEYKIDINVIVNFINLINIYEEDIYGKSIYDILIDKYSKKDINYIKK